MQLAWLALLLFCLELLVLKGAKLFPAYYRGESGRSYALIVALIGLLVTWPAAVWTS